MGWAVAFGVVVLCAAGTAQAELFLNVTSATVMEGGSGFVDVFLTIPSGQYRLAGYMVELIINGPTDKVRFTNFAEPDDAIFPGRTAEQTPLRPALPGQIAAANDYLPVGDRLIKDGDKLVRLWFAADPGSVGLYTVTFDTRPARTNLSDGEGNLLTINGWGSGTIEVVPEPSSLLLAAMGSVGTWVLCTVWRRNRRRA